MTKQDFIQQFVLRYMTSDSVVKEYVRPSTKAVIAEAKEVWLAMQSDEDTDIPRLVSLAEKALLRLSSGKYMSQDKDGDWVVFETEPELHPSGEMWRCGKGKGQYMRFARELPPVDFRKQCYRISDLLGTQD